MLKREFIACERNDNRFFADNSWAMIFVRFFIELWQEWVVGIKIADEVIAHLLSVRKFHFYKIRINI